MIIEYKNTCCDFVDLCFGQAFILYADGEEYICMKINDDIENHLCVHLDTGEVFEIEPHRNVKKINAKVIIE